MAGGGDGTIRFGCGDFGGAFGAEISGEIWTGQTRTRIQKPPIVWNRSSQISNVGPFVSSPSFQMVSMTEMEKRNTREKQGKGRGGKRERGGRTRDTSIFTLLSELKEGVCKMTPYV